MNQLNKFKIQFQIKSQSMRRNFEFTFEETVRNNKSRDGKDHIGW